MKPSVRYHLYLAFVVLFITLAGCGGVRFIPINERVRDADRKFDAAEAFRIKADKDTEQEKRHEQVKQKNALYDEALNTYRAIVKAEPTGTYAQRCLWQISEIYSRRYDWDKVIESYNAITAIAPLSYYGDRAKSAIADMRKYRGLIKEAQRKYKEYSGLYVQNNARESYDIAAQALYDVAESYKKLGDYPEAITHYQRVVNEFPDYEKAPMALTKIGEIHFYKLYDYQGGWPAYNKVIEMYPDSHQAKQAVQILKETDHCLREIARYEAEIRWYRYDTSKKSYVDGRPILPIVKYLSRDADAVVQSYQIIARCWENLRNYPRAIAAYRTLEGQPLYTNFAVADASYQIARLHQLDRQLERAIEAYQDFIDKYRESFWRNEGIYQQAVCYRDTHEFLRAYYGFKTYIRLRRDGRHYQEAVQIVRQYERDQDGDGYKFYVEKEAGTSDQDPDDYPAAIF